MKSIFLATTLLTLSTQAKVEPDMDNYIGKTFEVIDIYKRIATNLNTNFMNDNSVAIYKSLIAADTMLPFFGVASFGFAYYD